MMQDRVTKELDGKQWLRLCRSVSVSERQGFRVEVDIEHDLALFRIDGVVRCVTNVCPHKRIALIYDGYISDGTVTCPMHGWRFDICTGANTVGGGGLRTYEVKEESGWVWLLES
ncbi:MAG: Rieske (2Fe-2S) protein [Candidatus Kapabacteria bacterium]|nr:Rieske (2Fe-2S) protein [Candidatus Kapabacteria bacterium]